MGFTSFRLFSGDFSLVLWGVAEVPIYELIGPNDQINSSDSSLQQISPKGIHEESALKNHKERQIRSLVPSVM